MNKYVYSFINVIKNKAKAHRSAFFVCHFVEAELKKQTLLYKMCITIFCTNQNDLNAPDNVIMTSQLLNYHVGSPLFCQNSSDALKHRLHETPERV